MPVLFVFFLVFPGAFPLRGVAVAEIQGGIPGGSSRRSSEVFGCWRKSLLRPDSGPEVGFGVGAIRWIANRYNGFRLAGVSLEVDTIR